MNNQVHYRTARQEALRKGLIAKLWAEARSRGWDKEEMYEAIGALAAAKLVYTYKYNWLGRGDASRISISSLKLWQLRDLLAVLCGDGENRRNGAAEKRRSAQIVNMEECAI